MESSIQLLLDVPTADKHGQGQRIRQGSEIIFFCVLVVVKNLLKIRRDLGLHANVYRI